MIVFFQQVYLVQKHINSIPMTRKRKRATTLEAGSLMIARKYNALTHPVVQVLDIKEIGNQRIRLIISDGMHYHQSVLQTHLNQLITRQEIVRNTVIQLVNYQCVILQRPKEKINLLFIRDLRCMSQESEVIGNPHCYEEVLSK